MSQSGFINDAHTCRGEGFGSHLTIKLDEREGRADTFEAAEVAIDHRGLTWSETKTCVVCLAPLFVEDPRTCKRVWACRALWMETRHASRRMVRPKDETYTLVLFGNINEAELEHALEEPVASEPHQSQREAVRKSRICSPFFKFQQCLLTQCTEL